MYGLGNNNSNNTSSFTTNYSMSTMNKRSLNQTFQIMGVLGIINLIVSLYLAFGKGESGSCDFSATVSCSTVLNSPYGKILNVPVAIFGITWNCFFLYAVWRAMIDDRVSHFITGIYIWCSAGVGFVIYFVIAEMIIGALCPFCTVVHVINCILMYYAFKLYCDLKTPPPMLNVAINLRNVIVLILLMHMIILICFKGSPVVPLNESFSQCLGRKNMVFFGSAGCHVCQNQKALFIDTTKADSESQAWKYVNFVECKGNAACTEWEITRYPTWILFSSDFDDENKTELSRKEGYMNKRELSVMSGCKYDENEK
ncbi:hypothetical protein CYY_001305 [Polysphondylium violaceum]|uniref:Vitamin K epoxide reductase domain-containing protein n=1 Tax=Polysphondylium violaceum TaxID=133409 RepID=A0A8J4Q275_9MYCE|nr:hypothetical protein CYY_001305 [Polysphondylium violaceum]